jgi:2-oxoglutarate ferredoxin oxidoreductase subunit beta
MNLTAPETPKLTRKDFASDQEVRWCPGCGDYAILAAVQSVMPSLGIPKEKIVFISGIGCSSRFPYYMNTYGFHSIHGRAPAIATGLKSIRPDLSVWVATGDGDALSIGGNHFIHLMRRNVDIKVLLFNNRIYGLTKGQYSPTSELGKKTKSTPFGSVDRPFQPLSVALGAEATFVARSIDVFSDHLKQTVAAAAEHKGTAFIEILQNCNIFNDGAWEGLTEREARHENVLYLEHGKPMVYGTAQPKGLALRGTRLEIVDAAASAQDILVHDAQHPDPMIAFMLSQLDTTRFPTPIGVFRAVQGPTYDEGIYGQVQNALRKGVGDLNALLRAADTWVVK